VWARFRSWPLWVQLLLWLVAWPVLGALLAARSPRLGSAANPVALSVLVIGGLVWVGMVAAGDVGDDPDAVITTVGTTDEEQAAAPTPTAEPTFTPTPEPSAEPADTESEDPEPADTAETLLTSTAEGDLEIHFIDVGQGDATLLRTADVAVLIDTGRHDANDVVPYLRSVGVERLDVVAVTHPHADHIGQFDRVLDAMPVDEVWWSGSTHTTQTFHRALAALEASGAAYEEPRAGDVTTVGGLLFEFVNPPVGTNLTDLHDASLSVRVTWGEVRLLLTGDAEAVTEQRMVAGHRDWLAAELYQVGHHGSSTSTTAALVEAVAPAVAVYSAGAGNSYGHPHGEVVDRLEAAGAAVYGTDVHGTVVVTTDGRTWSVMTESDAIVAAGDSGSGAPRAPPPTVVEPAEPPAEAPAEASSCGPGQVNINTAGLEELQQIIHIGPARAQDIIQMRPFASVDALTRISGIAAGRLAEIRQQGMACS
jgi:competence protein ComEC